MKTDPHTPGVDTPFRGPTPAEINAVLAPIAGHPNNPLANAHMMTFAQIETASAQLFEIELAVDTSWPRHWPSK